MGTKIITITTESPYFNDLIHLELLLWPNHEYQELYDETKGLKDYFFGFLVDEKLIAFIQISLRHDYVNGCDTSPVGYVEGIFVLESYRKQGIGRALIDYSCAFLKENGYHELASDALLENTNSHHFHQKMGFEEVEKIVCYKRKI